MGMQAGACLEPKGRLRGCREAGSVGRPLPLLPGQDGQVSTTALPGANGLSELPASPALPSGEAGGARSPPHRRREDAGAGRRPRRPKRGGELGPPRL